MMRGRWVTPLLYTIGGYVFKGPGKYAYEDRPISEIYNPDDIRIKIQGVGICGTDLHILVSRLLHSFCLLTQISRQNNPTKIYNMLQSENIWDK